MKNNGKSLEKTIRLIQETLKTSEDVQIFNNYKIPDESGNQREIDIYISSKINHFEINIAIECKDYKSKVPVKDIESFATKCNRIKQINKKIFISSNGFQKGAIDAAASCGIELYVAEEINHTQVKKWFPIIELKCKVYGELKDLRIILGSEYVSEAGNLFDLKNIIYFNNQKEKELGVFMLNVINIERKNIEHAALLEWLDLPEIDKYEPFFVDFNIALESGTKINIENNQTFSLIAIESSVRVQFDKSNPYEIQGRNLKNKKGENISTTIEVKNEKSTMFEIVYSKKGKADIYSFDDSGGIQKLETLFIYDPKTKSFKIE